MNLGEIEARWDAVIAPEDVDAPWRVNELPLFGGSGVRFEGLDAHNDIRATCSEPEVAAALAAARTDVPALIRRVRELEGALRSLADRAYDLPFIPTAIQWDTLDQAIKAARALLAPAPTTQEV
jgi:hypothetical protein